MSNDALGPSPLGPTGFHRSVYNGRLHHASASQVKTHQLCNRKWWFQKVARAEDMTSTAARDLGTEVHRQNEIYLKGGPAPDMDIAQSGLIHLPPPSPDLLVEVEMDPPLYFEGIPWTGKIDVVVPPLPTSPKEAWVIDHKTTSDFRYCKTPEELQLDVQMLSYAHWVALRYWGPGALHREGYRVKVSHVYYHTKPEKLGKKTPRSRRVDAWIDTLAITQAIPELVESVKGMVRDARATSQDEVSVNRDACNAFGGCPYRTKCKVAMNTPKNLTGLLKIGSKPAPAAPVPTPQVLAVPPVATFLERAEVAQDAKTARVCECRTDNPDYDCGQNPCAKWSAPAPIPYTPGPGLVLYIGCVPLTGPHAGIARPLETVVAPVAESVCRDYGVPDVRMIPYAEGKGQLAARLRENPPQGVFFVFKSHELAAVALEALVSVADVVVQGTGG